MKFDITRAWKDAAYRESLSDTQISALPANPVGELSDEALETAFGGWGGGNFSSVNRYEHNESYGLICEVNVYSLSIISNIAILGSVAQTCIKG